jgi:hypothetical protein
VAAETTGSVVLGEAPCLLLPLISQLARATLPLLPAECVTRAAPGPAGVVGAFAGLGLVIAGVTYAAYAEADRGGGGRADDVMMVGLDGWARCCDVKKLVSL